MCRPPQSYTLTHTLDPIGLRIPDRDGTRSASSFADAQSHSHDCRSSGGRLKHSGAVPALPMIAFAH
jgi:hypothetical protein